MTTDPISRATSTRITSNPSPAERLRELYAKTTAGPWFTLRDGAFADIRAFRKGSTGDAVASEIGRRNAEFMVAAHSLLPDLLSQNARLREALNTISAQFLNGEDAQAIYTTARAALKDTP